jgi:hypothetical protein
MDVRGASTDEVEEGRKVLRVIQFTTHETQRYALYYIRLVDG